MERCCYSLFGDFNGINMDTYTRIYIGDELCDSCFLFHCSEMEQVIHTYMDCKDISILLPILNESSFQTVEGWLSRMKDKYKNDFEVICNDIGSLMYFFEKRFHVMAGRLLTRVIMPDLRKQEENEIQSAVTRVELDATNLKQVHHLRQYNRSFYQDYSLYGHANNRCAFCKMGEGEIACKQGCYKQKLILENTYLDSTYCIIKTAILHEESPMNVEILFDRTIDIIG